MIAANPGMPAGPLREIASGGELSRVMLALLTVAHADADAGAGGSAEAEGPLLVFDEIDAGIGGHTARAVGEHLRDLAAGRQLLCITHLPQVAALASRHFTIAKDTGIVPGHHERDRARRRFDRRRARADARRGGGRPRRQAARPPAAQGRRLSGALRRPGEIQSSTLRSLGGRALTRRRGLSARAATVRFVIGS